MDSTGYEKQYTLWPWCSDSERLTKVRQPLGVHTFCTSRLVEEVADGGIEQRHPVSLGRYSIGKKKRQGGGRTTEGDYRLDYHNPNQAHTLQRRWLVKQSRVGRSVLPKALLLRVVPTPLTKR